MQEGQRPAFIHTKSAAFGRSHFRLDREGPFKMNYLRFVNRRPTLIITCARVAIRFVGSFCWIFFCMCGRRRDGYSPSRSSAPLRCFYDSIVNNMFSISYKNDQYVFLTLRLDITIHIQIFQKVHLASWENI